MDHTKRLVGFLHDLSYQDLPEEVITEAKLCVLDNIGVGLNAGRRPWSRMVAKISSNVGGKEEASVWGQTFKAPAQYAALANGNSAHGIEMDDRSASAHMHAGPAVIAAALGAGERDGIDGRTLLTAVVAGYETGYRVGYAMDGVKIPGIHSSGHLTIWCGVAAAAKAFELPEEQFLNAFGIAGSLASGINEFSQDPEGTMVKRLYGGWPAHNGVMACLFAEAGLTGPDTVLEGKYGYCQAFSRVDREPNLDALTENLGESFTIMDVERKPYASWGGGQLGIKAASDLLDRYGIQSDDIEEIEIGGSTKLLRRHDMKNPGSIMAIQYSLPYLVAITLSRGEETLRNPDEIWDREIFEDREVAELVEKTSLYIDDELEEIYETELTYGGTEVTITLKDGTERSSGKILHAEVDIYDMGEAEVQAKFRRIATPTLSERGSEDVIELVSSLEEVENVGELGELLHVESLPDQIDMI